MKTLPLIAPLALLSLAILPRAQVATQDTPPPKSSRPDDLLKDLCGQDAATRDRAMQAVRAEIMGQRTKAVYLLYWTLKNDVADPEKSRTVGSAMQLLGHIRAEQKDVVALLVGNLSFTDRSFPGTSGTRSAAPQLRALIEIGLPSLDPLARRVAETDDPVVRDRAAFVIDQVLGTDLAVLYVKDRRERETDPTRRQRLAALLDQIDKVQRSAKPKTRLGALRPPVEVNVPAIAPREVRHDE
jgi:hypothetical protein